jgi:hypothetical protein
MAYKVGISSGWWSIGKDPNLLGLALKAGSFGATGGVQFNQVDLDTILEFLEPDLKPILKRTLKELNIEVGLHGEVGQMIALESAERRFWEQSHDRFVTTISNGAELGFKYVNFHLSQTIQLQQQERELRPFGFTYQVVDFLGRPFGVLAEDGTPGGNEVKNYILRKISIRSGMYREISGEEIYRDREDKYQEKLENDLRAEAHRRIDTDTTIPTNVKRSPDIVRGVMERVAAEWRGSGELRRRETEFMYSVWKDPECQTAKYAMEAGEIDAYITVGLYMYYNNDPLWFNIVGDIEPETAYISKQAEFNAAVAAKYLEGHMLVKDQELNKRKESESGFGGTNAVEFCNKKKFYLLFEMPHTGQGQEGLNRLFHPLHSQYLIRKINAPYVKLCIDFEQTIANRIDLDKLLKEIEEKHKDFGSLTYLYHLGEPVVYFGTAHIPIMLGGRGMEILYRWFYSLRKTGFKDGIIIFERGGGRTGSGKQMNEVFEQSVFVMRQIIKYLEQDIPVKELPPEFFGLSIQNKDFYARQYTTMREHFMDPMQDLFTIPEESHTFLSKAAVEKQKGEVFSKRRFR